MLFQGSDGDEAEKRALSEPHKYVLKPQREGGGKLKNHYLMF